MQFARRSPLTGIVNVRRIDITPSEFTDWKYGGMLIQNAMPHVSADDRKFLMTGYTPEDWEKMFGDLDEDEDSDVQCSEETLNDKG